MEVTPFIQPFGPGTEKVRITDLTGQHLAAALQHYPTDHPWGPFLHEMHRKFVTAGGRPQDRVANLIDMSGSAVLGSLPG
jgi:hypothetical protein